MSQFEIPVIEHRDTAEISNEVIAVLAAASEDLAEVQMVIETASGGDRALVAPIGRDMVLVLGNGDGNVRWTRSRDGQVVCASVWTRRVWDDGEDGAEVWSLDCELLSLQDIDVPALRSLVKGALEAAATYAG
ncbi:hypothetical protein MUG78_17355 [Gordonia alkaliphila]|uniref:hypothetical protein n=1 Tax=Gordonia alkaliphila TaxID=1053547 RepID=UPI001FF216E2|nr:hypothetical protein [Gordonia alkaliphila]MCK0441169.1 hypothetical protein [Gordonia alkaliphila]